MLTTGASLHNWTILLLLCSASTSVLAETAANETTTAEQSAAGAYSGATTHRTSQATSLPLPSPSPSPLSTRRYSDSESTSPYRTINYITHTLPQQCAKTSWSAPGETAIVNGTGVEGGAIAGLQTPAPGIWEGSGGIANEERKNAHSDASSQPDATGAAPSAPSSGTEDTQPELELEVDSPFDNANFLSFEEWKKKNLAKAGQSPENVGQGRLAASNQAPRRRPVNVNALDSFGDEGEISIDFSGFGRPEDGGVANGLQQARHNAEATKVANGDGKVAPGSWALSKDAGKTCKERFNYASFDCAATVLKANKQAKSSSSILVENKDSYMLNICSADNKFLIVELCDDILVDTVVLANYEFFSSMFRHFRVSVSDRYPVKMEKWRTLGTFEARNSRDIQPFLITEPQIWARYLRVEFLTQYGNEYYCPLSLLRVHGTTMLEQFRQEEEEARGIDDDEDLEADGVEVKKPAADSGPLPPEDIPMEAFKDDGASFAASQVVDTTSHKSTPEPYTEPDSPSPSSEAYGSSTVAKEQPAGQMTDVPQNQQVSEQSSASSPTPTDNLRDLNVTSPGENNAPTATSTTEKAEASSPVHGSTTDSVVVISPSAPPNDNPATFSTESIASGSSSSSLTKVSSDGTVVPPQAQSQGRGSATQPNAPTPSTQESFFKSIHKRLQYLEANSTLSLQYIEEQSRALRDAFMKVEKRQLAKTEKFLDHLNSTVMIELKSFRNMYDQLWQSTVIELESMKERQKSEMGEIGTRLSLLADELVWQKRMAVVQSTLLLLCLGLVLFVRSGTLGSSADVPIVHQLGNKYTSFFETSPTRSTPNTTGMARRRSTFRKMWKSDTSAGLSDHHSDAETDGLRSPVQVECSSPIPDTPIARRRGSSLSPRLDSMQSTPVRDHTHDNMPPTPMSEDQAARIQVLATQSGPATPNGTRDSRPSWEEVDRAMDLLKAEEQNQEPLSPASSPSSSTQQQQQHHHHHLLQSQGGRERVGGGAGKKKKKRSPLRRAHSQYDEGGEEV
ncbi:UNC-like C-terminal-domain-containing protein, partial [Bipolaris maydis]|uniref:UNC-like C-terminal-domain-containing protein n=1 Tax=Cochliobolus heterostrophus TaxID=5016 RepID=UPI0024CFCA4F